MIKMLPIIWFMQKLSRNFSRIWPRFLWKCAWIIFSHDFFGPLVLERKVLMIVILLFWKVFPDIFIIYYLVYWYSWIPYPLYCGIIFSNLVWDNGNFIFILLILILLPLIDWISGIESKTWNFYILFVLLLIDLFLCFNLFSLLLLFIYYELLIIILFFILFNYIYSYYRIRSAFNLFIFSIIGTISFLISLLIFILSDWFLLILLIIAEYGLYFRDKF